MWPHKKSPAFLKAERQGNSYGCLWLRKDARSKGYRHKSAKILFFRFMYVSLALVVLPSAMTIFYFFIIKQATASISTPAFCWFFRTISPFSQYADDIMSNLMCETRQITKIYAMYFSFFLPQILQFCHSLCEKRHLDMHYPSINRILSSKRTSTTLYFPQNWWVHYPQKSGY